MQRWQAVAQHLAVVVAGELAGRMGVDAATEYMEDQVGLVLDPAAFRACLGCDISSASASSSISGSGGPFGPPARSR